MLGIKKPSEALRAARSLIEPEGAWAVNTMARDKSGEPASMRGSEACQWCMLGAVGKFADIYTTIPGQPYAYLKKAVGMFPGDFNDKHGRTHAEVLDALDRAAALAEAEGR